MTKIPYDYGNKKLWNGSKKFIDIFANKWYVVNYSNFLISSPNCVLILLPTML